MKVRLLTVLLLMVVIIIPAQLGAEDMDTTGNSNATMSSQADNTASPMDQNSSLESNETTQKPIEPTLFYENDLPEDIPQELLDQLYGPMPTSEESAEETNLNAPRTPYPDIENLPENFTPLQVVVSIPPQIEFVTSIAGATVEATSLVEEEWLSNGVSIDLAPLRDADLYITIGEPFETEVLTYIEEYYPKLPVIHGALGIGGLDIYDDGTFGFPWLSPEIARKISETTLMGLLSITEPDFRVTYMQRFELYVQTLIQLQDSITRELSKRRGVEVASEQPGFYWMLIEFGLHEFPFTEDNQDSIITSLNNYKERGGRVVLTTTQDSTNIESLLLAARSFGLTVIQVNPYSQEYFDNVNSLGKLLNSYVQIAPTLGNNTTEGSNG